MPFIETILMLLAMDPSFSSSSLISKIPSTIELTALISEFADVILAVNVKIAVASNSFRSKGISRTSCKTALSQKRTTSCVSESTTTSIDLRLPDNDDDCGGQDMSEREDALLL